MVSCGGKGRADVQWRVCWGNIHRTRGDEVQSLGLRGMEDEAESVAGRAITSKLLTHCQRFRGRLT